MSDDRLDEPLTSDENNDNRQQQPIENFRSFFERPIEDLRSFSREAFSISDFWQDMTRREGTVYHQATLVLGVLSAVIVAVYCILVKVEKATEDDTFRDYVIIEMLIVGAAQLFYSGNGICVENASMLLAANINAVLMAVRLAFKRMLFDVPNWTLVAIFGVIALGHFFTSFMAFRAAGGFHRFITFTMGTQVHIQRMYRFYEQWKTAAVMDMQLSIMASATIVFFMTTELWHYVVFAILFLLSVALRSSLRFVIRQERMSRAAFWYLLLPLYLLFPAFLSISFWWSDFLHVDVQRQSTFIAYFTILLFFVFRILLLAATYRCFFHFGLGMKKAFKMERSVAEFFVSWRLAKVDGQHATAKIEVDGEEFVIPVFIPRESDLRDPSSPQMRVVDEDQRRHHHHHKHRHHHKDEAKEDEDRSKEHLLDEPPTPPPVNGGRQAQNYGTAEASQ